ncbi:MAG: hypothetical protein M0O93_06970 [Bacteroidales bacterium]|nr:hypothetical protein [Bacteroidales bacterium]
MDQKFPVKVDFTKYEIIEYQFSKKELRERIEKMLEKYPKDTIFDRASGFIILGVLEENK